MTVTDKSPKRFRFMLVSRLQNYALDVIVCLISANEIFVSRESVGDARERLHLQRQAMARLKLLGYLSELAMKQQLRKIPDRNVLGLLFHIIRSYVKTVDPLTGEAKGLPLGNQTSQWFALYYLDPMDRFIKEKMRIKHYVRYMDDGVMIHESKEYLKEVLRGMEEVARALKLEFNQKTQIAPISQRVDFLGFHFYLTDSGKVIRRLRTSGKRRWKRRLRKFREQYRNGEKTSEEISRSIVSYRGHLSHGHTWKLQKKVMGGFVLKK